MGKKFKYNHETLDFYEAKRTWLGILRRVPLMLFVGGLLLVGYYLIFSRFFSTPQERQLAEINRTLTENYKRLDRQYAQLQKVVDDLEQRDANIYYRIFEADLPASAAENFTSVANIEYASNTALTKQTKEQLDRLSKVVDEQTANLKKIIAQAQKNPHVESIPAIQPVQNNDLRRTAATYGMRMHPFYKVLKMHSGVDFTAPLGDNVFATGNARVEAISSSMRNSGLTITLNHGNGYKTSYSHLLKANVKVGDKVKRGSVIGLVGNSGRSVAPHLHYEIEKDGQTINPIHYFFKDVTPDEYQQLIAIAKNKGQSLD